MLFWWPWELQSKVGHQYVLTADGSSKGGDLMEFVVFVHDLKS